MNTAPAADWSAAARSALAGSDAALAARVDRGEDVDALLVARTREVDALVREAWAQCLPEDAPLALFAVGGYGRGELFPQSDIDVMVLAEASAQARWHEALSQLFALLWDAGLPAGHAVRSRAQCTEAARGDITVLTALLEARPLCASEADVAALAAAVEPALAWPAAF